MANSHGRTKENTKRLRLKEFFKRIIPVNIIPSCLDCKLLDWVHTGEIQGSGASNNKPKSQHDYWYEIKPYDCIRSGKGFKLRFSKPQVVGKVFLLHGIYHRVISRSQRPTRRYW